jgi:hypothetical protein
MRSGQIDVNEGHRSTTGVHVLIHIRWLVQLEDCRETGLNLDGNQAVNPIPCDSPYFCHHLPTPEA